MYNMSTYTYTYMYTYMYMSMYVYSTYTWNSKKHPIWKTDHCSHTWLQAICEIRH